MTERQRRSDDEEVDLPSTQAAESNFDQALSPETIDEGDRGTVLPNASTCVPMRASAGDDPYETLVAHSQDGSDLSGRQIQFNAMVRGDQISDFRIQRLLGKGSFGAVYLTRELSLDRLVALKVVLPEGKKSTAGEGRSLARLKHPNIVGVYGESEDQSSGCSLLWMQYVDGMNLASLIQRLAFDRSEDWDERDLLRELAVGGRPGFKGCAPPHVARWRWFAESGLNSLARSATRINVELLIATLNQPIF